MPLGFRNLCQIRCRDRCYEFSINKPWLIPAFLLAHKFSLSPGSNITERPWAFHLLAASPLTTSENPRSTKATNFHWSPHFFCLATCYCHLILLHRSNLEISATSVSSPRLTGYLKFSYPSIANSASKDLIGWEPRQQFARWLLEWF